ncbi:MAG TPA: hypothetical protein VEC57_11410 [Candidatus Limnocylindrales bacterium]|nr:hypothetical protein [Candidatus Limnocylindrales bacterium]
MPDFAHAYSLWIGGEEEPRETFARDLRMLLRCSEEGRGHARLWRASAPSLSLGRFHRRAAGSAALARRFSGGRIVPLGPGVQCLTLAVPSVDWLDPATTPLRPDQVLNRALRPLLEVLRAIGVDVFYPGRDLVTARGRALAHASFTVMRDGAALIEMHVAQATSFAVLPAYLSRFDPAGVAAADMASMESAVSLSELGIEAMTQEQWADRLAAIMAAALEERAATGTQITEADESAWAAHQDELGPAPPGSAIAAMPSMLGVVECSATLQGDRLRQLRISGDVIAPFHTLDDLAAECEGLPFRLPQVRRVLARVLSQPRSFVLGVTNLDELIGRLA